MTTIEPEPDYSFVREHIRAYYVARNDLDRHLLEQPAEYMDLEFERWQKRKAGLDASLKEKEDTARAVIADTFGKDYDSQLDHPNSDILFNRVLMVIGQEPSMPPGQEIFNPRRTR